MSAVSNFATPVPGTKTPGSKDREVPPFVGNLLARWDAGYAGDRSAQSNSRVLTPRERDVLAMISQGFSNKCIARAFEISPETVKSHVKRIFLKLAVNTRAEAVCRAGSLGLLGLDSGHRHGPSQMHPGQGKFVQEVPDRARNRHSIGADHDVVASLLHHGLFTTLARTHPTATAVAIRDGRYLAVGADTERPPGECKSDAGGRGGRLDG